jgi:rubrerythrin
MVTRALRFPFIVFFFTVLFLVPLINAQSRYPKTISALQIAYHNEIQAYLNYSAYAQKATLENYPNLAYLFVSFATSESIHARNFKQILSDLGVEMEETTNPKVEISTSRMNLKNALDFEIEDIDKRYPQLIEKSKPEEHQAAIQNIIYTWESEKQHRGLLRKARLGTGIFFGILAKKIETTFVQCFVCQNCGSTLLELPKDTCPICKGPVSQYKEVERIK